MEPSSHAPLLGGRRSAAPPVVVGGGVGGDGGHRWLRAAPAAAAAAAAAADRLSHESRPLPAGDGGGGAEAGQYGAEAARRRRWRNGADGAGMPLRRALLLLTLVTATALLVAPIAFTFGMRRGNQVCQLLFPTSEIVVTHDTVQEGK